MISKNNNKRRQDHVETSCRYHVAVTSDFRFKNVVMLWEYMFEHIKNSGRSPTALRVTHVTRWGRQVEKA